MRFKIQGIKNAQLTEVFIQAKTQEKALEISQKSGIYVLNISIDSKLNFSLKSLFSYQEELLLSFKQIGFMLSASLPIDQVLLSSQQSSKHPKIISMYEDILKNIQVGNSLTQSFKKYENIISLMHLKLIEIGEKSGQLPEIFLLIANEMQQNKKDIQLLQKSLFYPFIVFISIILAFIALNFLVLPEFIKLFKDLNLSIPLTTKSLIVISETINSYGFIILFLFLFIGVIFRYFFKKSHYFFEKTLIKIPIFGKIILFKEFYRYFLGLYLCQKTGIDIENSLENAYNGIKNSYVKHKIKIILSSIKEGKSLSQAFMQVKILSNIPQGLILAGEKSGELEHMLKLSSEYYYDLYLIQTENIIKWIQPLATIFVGIIVLWFSLGILMPMWNLNDGLGF